MTEIITRIEDLPYLKSPPMQILLTQSASLTAGQYIFNGGRTDITNNKNINDQGVYYLKSLSFSADIGLLDYQIAMKLSDGTTDIPRRGIL